MPFENLIFTKENGIGVITVNRPEKRNALDRKTRQEMRRALTEIERDQDIQVLIITGAGDKAFVSGADINDFKELYKTPLAMYDYTSTLGQQLFSDIEKLDIPVIAMINGYCLGGGCELAVACDIRIASEKAKFGHPEISLGFIPGGGATQRLPRLIGDGRSKLLIYTGEIIDAGAAERIGLVDRVVRHNELKDAVMEVALKIVRKSPVAIRFAKKALNAGRELPQAMGLAYERTIASLCSSTEDHREGIDAFLEKRPPKFKGK